MLHDIVLALGGVGGAVLVKILSEEIVSLSSFTFHPCERNILAQIINMADSYKSIQDFVKMVPHFGDEYILLEHGNEMPPGMYLRAFCNGLYDCLEPYRKNLINVEKGIIEDVHQTATGILAQVAPYTPLLTALNSVINQIVTRQLHGCKILQLVQQHLSSGIEIVDEAMARIMQCCHLVLLKQVTSVLLFGKLMDPYKEFFIQEEEYLSDLQNTSISTVESVTNKPGSKGVITTQYFIIEDMVPCYIPPSVPEKIRFIGSTVVMLSSDPRNKKSGLNILKYNSLYKKMESTLLTQLKALQNVSAQDFSSMLEAVIDNIQSCVTEHLLSLAKDDANLLGELQLIKDYFLLGRGELFVVFLQKASSILLKPIMNNHTSQDLNSLLHISVQNVHLSSDLISNKISFKVPLKDKSPVAQPVATVWKQMQLQYMPPWPLHLLFRANEMDVYNRLFNFLLQVKMVELNLHHVWLENVKIKDLRLSASVWTLRNTLQYLIGNLQCYLQLDVIEGRFSQLCSALDQTQDFHQVVHLHSVFLSSVTSECFIDLHCPQDDQPGRQHPVNRCLMKILRLCDEFCAEAGSEEIRDTLVEKIGSQLNDNMCVLMNLLDVLGTKASGLRLLLLRLDYNRYFSSRVMGETTPPS